MQRHSLRLPNRLTAYLVLVVLALANGGCLLAVAGATGGAAVGYAYYMGKLCETFAAGLDDTWAATRTALSELAMPIVNEERKASEGFIESRTADGERVRVYLQVETSKIPAEGQITRVCVRIATFGEHPVSDRILNQVGIHLAPVPGAAAPPAAALGVIQTGAPPTASPPATVAQQTAPPPLLPPEPVHTPQQPPK